MQKESNLALTLSPGAPDINTCAKIPGLAYEILVLVTSSSNENRGESALRCAYVYIYEPRHVISNNVAF